MPLLYNPGIVMITLQDLIFTVGFSDTGVSKGNNYTYFYNTMVPGKYL